MGKANKLSSRTKETLTIMLSGSPGESDSVIHRKMIEAGYAISLATVGVYRRAMKKIGPEKVPADPATDDDGSPNTGEEVTELTGKQESRVEEIMDDIREKSVDGQMIRVNRLEYIKQTWALEYEKKLAYWKGYAKALLYILKGEDSTDA